MTLVALVALVGMAAGTAVASATEWTSQPTPRLAREQTGTLAAVSCSSPTACMAVGNESRGTAPMTPLAERFNGASWTIQALPHEPYGELKAVSCSSSTSCLAVGSLGSAFNARSSTGDSTSQLVEHFNGRRWTVVPAPTRADASLTSVSCGGARACIAVGETSSRSPLAERFDGTSLTAIPSVPAVLPNGVEGVSSMLASVSCTSPIACTAVGNEAIFWLNPNAGGEGGAPPGTSDLPLAQHWDGSTWSAEPLPASLGWPLGASAISCAAENRCVAVGQTTNTAVQIASFDGSNWLAEPVNLPSSHGNPALSALSCSSLTACTAVGSIGPKLGVLRFNGTTWRSQTLPTAGTRALTSQGQLTGVSCPTMRFCVAVGSPNALRPPVLKWTGGR
jgi:hypothetical protein